MTTERVLRIGSRASALAMAQAVWVGNELKKHHPHLEITYTHLTTSGDRDQTSSLQTIGGKGVFVKEIEDALLRLEIDLAVHSLKDVPQMLPHGLMIGPCPMREDPRDALLSRFGEQLHELPKQSVIGTSSPRRAEQLKRMHKKRSYRVTPIRGNVDTRINKLQAGDYDAVVMATAGLKRLGLEKEITQILEIDEMMPAPCQGCLGLELRMEDKRTAEIIQAIKHEPSDIMARAERAFLQALGGSCLAPVASTTTLSGETLTMEALLLDPASEVSVRARENGPHEEAELIGAKLAGRMLFEGGSEIIIQLNKGSSPHDVSSGR